MERKRLNDSWPSGWDGSSLNQDENFGTCRERQSSSATLKSGCLGSDWLCYTSSCSLNFIIRNENCLGNNACSPVCCEIQWIIHEKCLEHSLESSLISFLFVIQEYSFFSPSFILTHLICPGFGFVISFVVLSINFLFTLFFRIFEIFIFIYLAALGLSCCTWEPLLQHANS